MKSRVLVLGVGFVARSMLDILVEGVWKLLLVSYESSGMTIANFLQLAELSKALRSRRRQACDPNLSRCYRRKGTHAVVAMHDLLISLIPYGFHATIIKSAIRNKKNVVTTSYVSPAMIELDEKYGDIGIIILNKVGLNPGVGNSAHPLFKPLSGAETLSLVQTRRFGRAPAPKKLCRHLKLSGADKVKIDYLYAIKL
jgi:saccharopine dehydrogenase (NADP+, L-glutamate forming)